MARRLTTDITTIITQNQRDRESNPRPHSERANETEPAKDSEETAGGLRRRRREGEGRKRDHTRQGEERNETERRTQRYRQKMKELRMHAHKNKNKRGSTRIRNTHDDDIHYGLGALLALGGRAGGCVVDCVNRSTFLPITGDQIPLNKLIVACFIVPYHKGARRNYFVELN